MIKGQGNKIAGSNPTRGRVDNDYYATHPDSTIALLEVEEIIYPALEPACGEGHISKLLDETKTDSFDLVYRGYGTGNKDFLKMEPTQSEVIGDLKLHSHKNSPLSRYNTIITNPPFNLFQDFLEKALGLSNKKVIFFGKLQALEGKKRGSFMQKYPPKIVYVFKSRQQPLRNGSNIDELTGKKMASSTMAFAWFVWEKGFTGDPIIKWLN
jgi:hypothetical protein